MKRLIKCHMDKREDLHFLTDSALLKRMAAEIPEGSILEIGPGHGELTRYLVKKGPVIAIEKSQELASQAKKAVKGAIILHGNALRMITSQEFDILVSNLPYSLCEPLFRLLPLTSFSKGFFTIPKKFTERLHELPYSCFFSVRIVFPVPKDAFSPPPRTASVFVSVARKPRTVMGSVLLKRTMAVKNAVREALVQERGLTKREAREKITRLFSGKLPDKKVHDIDSKELAFLDRCLQKV